MVFPFEISVAVDGSLKKAEFSLSRENNYWVLLIESANSTRNTGYNAALELLLERLTNLKAVLIDAVVDARDLLNEGLSPRERRIPLDFPIHLENELDPTQLRIGITGKASKVHAEGGNRQRKLRFNFTLSEELSMDELLYALSGGDIQKHLKRNIFLLNWNPSAWKELTEEEIESWQDKTSNGEKVGDLTWSTGSRKSGISIGDIVFLLRQGKDRRGLLAKGVAVSEIFEDDHWDGSGRLANYIAWEAEEVLSVNRRLPTETLIALNTGTDWNRLQGSGVKLPDEDAAIIINKWRKWYRNSNSGTSGDEAGAIGALFEGAKKTVKVNAYERNTVARNLCLEEYGYSCYVCGFNFEETYGEIGKEYIHVHHLVDISIIGKEYEIDPLEDLRPLCPNCHAMVHKRRPAFLIDELKEVLTQHKRTISEDEPPELDFF